MAPLARIAISGLKVLMVPQSFRYEELPSGSTEEQLFASARTVSAAQEGNVIVLDVPATRSNRAWIAGQPDHLDRRPEQVRQPVSDPGAGSGFQAPDILTLNLADLYDAMNEDRGGK
jgi:hypothetical protein